MSVLAFRKRTEALQDVEQQIRPVNTRNRRSGTNDWSTPEDFSREVELTRGHELLMAVLRDRALDPPTVSLHEVRRKIEVGRLKIDDVPCPGSSARHRGTAV